MEDVSVEIGKSVRRESYTVSLYHATSILLFLLRLALALVLAPPLPRGRAEE